MNNPIFSQAAIFRLQQLASLIHKHTGVRYKLSEPDSLMGLLRYSAQAPTPSIAMQYQALIRVLTREERESLQAQSIPLAPIGQIESSRLGREAV